MVSFTNIKLMKKIILCLFVFFISCSSTTESETPTTKEEILPESNVTLPISETHDHDDEGHDHDDETHDHDDEGHDHDDEGHDHDDEGHDHDDEGQVYFDEVIVPESAPESLQILTYNLSDKAVLYFISTVETEVHVHGYDIHFMVYPDKENKLSINLSIAGEFEIEDHESGVEFARLIVNP